uniref:Uncharacterized protein n=1 Tax=Arundo donax TaxID=35708 RepID=A0A0A9GX77_ARUDO
MVMSSVTHLQLSTYWMQRSSNVFVNSKSHAT